MAWRCEVSLSNSQNQSWTVQQFLKQLAVCIISQYPWTGSFWKPVLLIRFTVKSITLKSKKLIPHPGDIWYTSFLFQEMFCVFLFFNSLMRLGCSSFWYYLHSSVIRSFKLIPILLWPLCGPIHRHSASVGSGNFHLLLGIKLSKPDAILIIRSAFLSKFNLWCHNEVQWLHFRWEKADSGRYSTYFFA